MNLSAYEACMAASTLRGMYNNFIVGAQYTVPLNLETIADTLSVMCGEYPQFSLTLQKAYVAEYILEYDVVDCVDVVEGMTVEEVLQQYTKLQFSYGTQTPLWKVVLEPVTNTLFFVVDHLFFDGTAGKNFHSEFCSVLGKRGDRVVKAEFAEYPTSTEMMQFKERCVEDRVCKVCVPEMDAELMKLPMYCHNYRVVQLEKEDMRKLVELARDNEFKLTGLMYAVASKAIAECFKSCDRIRAMIAINSRFKVAEEFDRDLIKFGLFYGTYFHVDDVEFVRNVDVFEIGRKFQKGLDERRDKCMESCEVFETKAKGDIECMVDQSLDELKERNGKPLTTLTISNLGVLQEDKINCVYFDQPMIDSAFALHLLSSPQKLSLNFTSHRAIPCEMYESFIRNAMHTISIYTNS